MSTPRLGLPDETDGVRQALDGTLRHALAAEMQFKKTLESPASTGLVSEAFFNNWCSGDLRRHPLPNHKGKHELVALGNVVFEKTLPDGPRIERSKRYALD